MKDFVKAQFTVKYNESPLDKWKPNITNENVYAVTQNRGKYIEKTKIGYTIKLDIAALTKHILE